MFPENSADDLPKTSDQGGSPAPAQWAGATAPYESDRCIHEWFELQTRRLPSATALVFRDQRLSYQDLNASANRLAHCLRSLGAGPDKLVAIHLDRGVQMVIAILAVLKSGGAYVPLDASYPKARLLTILADAQAPLLVTRRSLAEGLGWDQGKQILLDDDAAAIAACSAENPELTSCGQNTAFALFTSGSTGTPKGVLVSHANLVNYRLLWQIECDFSDTVSAVLQTTFFSFAVFQGDVIRALCFGKKLVLCSHDELQSPESTLALMQREGVDFAEVVPAMLRNLVAYLRQAEKRLDFMRVMVVGADRWYGREHLEAARYLGPETRFIHVYGSSETTLDSTRFEHRGQSLPADQATPIGRPFTNVRAYVLDAGMRPLPVGIEGELCIGGAGVARGYLNRPELTAERFCADPFDGSPGARMFRTGDLAKRLPDGNLVFLGRADQQVKINGFRIELGEIEAALERHPQVVTGLVQATEAVAGPPRLVAYFLPRSPAPTTAELRRFLATCLPTFMLPARLVALTAVPLTPSGKIDRKALPAVDGDRPDLETAFAPPIDDLQRLLAQIWQQVLRLGDLGVDDNFFELGGSSLLMTQVNLLVRQALQRDVDIVTMYRHPTIASLARALSIREQAAAPGGAARAAQRRSLMNHRRRVSADPEPFSPDAPAKLT